MSEARTSVGRRGVRRLRPDAHTLFLLVLVLVIFIVMSFAMPTQFPTAANLESMAFQMPELGILTMAMMLAMLTGGIDLSITATANLSAITGGIVMASLIKPDLSVAGDMMVSLVGLLAAAAVGAICGAVNGLLIGRVGVSAILTTLSTMTLYTGLAYGITQGHAVHGVPRSILFVGIGKFLGTPTPMIIFVVVLMVISTMLNHTAYGFKVYMLGSSATAARFSGINNATVILKTYIATGLLSTITGLVTLGRTNSANADYGSSYVLMAILVAVLGGVAVSGGSGRVSGVVLALLTLQMLSTGFNMLLFRFSGSNFFRDFAWGLLLLLVMVLTQLIRRGKTWKVWKQVLSPR